MPGSPLQPYTVGRRPERMDRIARRIYGTERNSTVELLWAANPGLALCGAFVPAGTVIVVPPAPATKAAAVQLAWE